MCNLPEILPQKVPADVFPAPIMKSSRQLRIDSDSLIYQVGVHAYLCIREAPSLQGEHTIGADPIAALPQGEKHEKSD
jgi:hypothetical protein